MGREYYQMQNKNKQPMSFSRLTTFIHCNYEYYLTYIKKLPRLDNIYGKIGGKVHELCEKLQRNEIDNQTALDDFLTEVEDWKMFDIKFPSEKVEKNYKECVAHFFNNYKPIECTKYEIEKGFDIIVGQSDTLLLGFIDLIIFLSDKEIFIYDYKTSSKFSKKDLEEKKMQLLAYALGCIRQYDLKPVKLGFSMLKYCEITWHENGKDKSTVTERNNIGFRLKVPVKRILKKMGYDELDIEMKLDIMERTNEIVPEIKDVFAVSDYYINVDLNEESLKEFEDFVDKTMAKIKSKKEEQDYKPVYLTEATSFYCSILCSQRKNCKYFKYYLDKNIDNLKQATMSDELDDLL